MADSQDESDSIVDATDDGQLTIRIPNPKVYMARQSQWIGRRGKPRCDHCRLNNLKCDRVLPTCNHCSWAFGRECKYTPLPTPAHRGIPRCDRCRLKNLKCDRNLPVCNHCSEEDETECNYTPKKRHKVPSDHITVKEQQPGPYATKAASFLVSDIMTMEEQEVDSVNSNDDYADQRHSFYGLNIASSSRFPRTPQDSHDRDRDQDRPQESRFTRVPSSFQSKFAAHHPGRVVMVHPTLPAIAPKTPPITNQLSFISHTFPADKGIMISQFPIDSWSHPTFSALPDVVRRRLADMDAVEMPDRNAYDDSLDIFLSDLREELREVAAFSPDMYMLIHRSIVSGDLEMLSPRIRMWLSIHHACSGSNKQCLLLLPRDDYFQLDAAEEEKMRQMYVTLTDRKTFFAELPSLQPFSHDTEPLPVDPDFFERKPVFERIPVQPQIYDIMCFAHDKHTSSYEMMHEIRKLGFATVTWPMAEIFVQLCPVCAGRKQPLMCHVSKLETSSTGGRSGSKT